MLFINGQHAGNGGTSAYWEGYDLRAMAQLGDLSARYIDGAMGGWSTTFAWGLTPLKSNIDPATRFLLGRLQGIANAEDIVRNLVDGETIKIVTHSMGTGFARGYTQGIMMWARANGLEHKIRFEYGVDINPFQGALFPADGNVERSETMMGGLDGGTSTPLLEPQKALEMLRGNSVPSVALTPNAKNITDPADASKGHAVVKMSTRVLPNLGNGGEARKVEQGNNNENNP